MQFVKLCIEMIKYLKKGRKSDKLISLLLASVNKERYQLFDNCQWIDYRV